MQLVAQRGFDDGVDELESRWVGCMLEGVEKLSAITVRDVEFPWRARCKIMGDYFGNLCPERLGRDYYDD